MKPHTLFFTLAGLGAIGVFAVRVRREVIAARNMSFEPTAFRLINVQSGQVMAELDVSITNPSLFKIHVKNLFVEAILHGESLASSNTKFTIKPNGRTIIDVPVELTLKKVLRLAEDVLLKDEAIVIFKGVATCKAFGFSVQVPLEFMIDVKQELNDFLKGRNLIPLL